MAAIWIWLQEIMLFIIAPSQRITWRDVWNQFLLRLCVVKSRMTVDSKEKKRLLEWVSTKIRQGKPPRDFNDSWKNGITLCAVVEGIMKGSCPRYDLLNPEHSQSNLKLGLHLIEKNIRIKPGLTVEDFTHYDAVTERKLVCLVSQLKLASAKLRLKSVIQRPVISLNRVTTIGAEGECIAKGMGLMLAVKGRKARFHIYLKSLTMMNIVVEIRGPENTICSERITSRSPKRRSSVKLEENEEEWKKIPLEYNIQPGKITVSYTPLAVGSHRLSIIWQGQHIIGSPYIISVDDAARTVAAEPKEIKRLIVPLKRADSLEDFAKKGSIKYGKMNSTPYSNVRKLGNVTRRRVLRHYLIVDGTEVVIENSDLESLATAVKNLRIKSKSNNSECYACKPNNCNISVHCDKSGDNKLAHKDNKKENIISSNSHLDMTVEIMENSESINHKSAYYKTDKSDNSVINAFNETSMNNILNGNECINNTNAINFQQPNGCIVPPKESNLYHKSRNLYSKQKEGNKSSSQLQVSLSSNSLECTPLSFYNISKNIQHNTKEVFSANSPTNNLLTKTEELLKQTRGKLEASTYPFLPEEKHKMSSFTSPDVKSLQPLSSHSKLKTTCEVPISTRLLHKGIQDFHLQNQSTALYDGVTLTSNIQQKVITRSKEKLNSPCYSQEEQNLTQSINQFLEFPMNSTCDLTHQDNFSSNVVAEEINMQDEHNKNNSVAIAHLKSMITAISTPVSISNPSKFQTRDNTEMLVNNAFESKIVETNCTTKEAADHVYPALIDVLPIDNTDTQNFGSFNWNVAKRQNSKEESKTRHKDSENRSDNTSQRSFNNKSLQSLETMAQILIHSSDTNIQENNQNGTIAQGMAVKIISIPEKLCSEKFDQICCTKSDVILSTCHLTANDNDITEDSSEVKVCSEHNLKHYQENKTILEQLNNDMDVTEGSRHESELLRNDDQENYQAEEILLKSNCINTVEETIRENQDDLTIKLTNELSGISEKFSCDQRGRSLSEQNEKGISMVEGNNLHDIACRVHQGNTVIKYIEENVSGTKQPNNEEIIQPKNNWNDHEREGFLLGLIGENFKIVESPNAENAKFPETCYHVFEDKILCENSTSYDAYNTGELSDNVKWKISMEFDKCSSPEIQRRSNAPKTKLSINEQVKPTMETLSSSQGNFESKSNNLNSLYNDIKVTSNEVARYSQSSITEKNICSLGFVFDKHDSAHCESNFANLSQNQSLQNVIVSSSSNLSHSTNQSRTSTNHKYEKSMFSDSDGIDNAICNYEPQITEASSISSNHDNNSDNVKVQNETLTKLQKSELAENITIYNKHSTNNNLNILKEADEILSMSPQEEFCCNLEKVQCMSDSSSSVSLEPSSLLIQYLDNTRQQSSEVKEFAKCFSDDEEEEFPFAAIVQAKKEYWERKLEEKSSKQVPKVCSVTKDGNNVDKLKSFWQHVAKDSDRTKVYMHQSSSNR